MVETRTGLHTEPQTSSGGTKRAKAPSRQFSTRQLYTMLALMFVALSVPLTFAPKQVTKFAFGHSADPVSEQHLQLFRIYGTELLSAAAISFALEEATRKSMLQSFTGDTLKLSLIGFAAFKAAEYIFYPFTKTPWAMALELAVLSLTFLLPASQLLFSRSDRSRFRLPPSLPRFKPSTTSITAFFYTFLTIAMPLSGLMYIILPKYTMYHGFGYVYGTSTIMLWRAIGGGHISLLTGLCYTLKEKADDGLLSKSIARILNIGLLATSVGHMLILGPMLSNGQQEGGFLLPLVTAMWGSALLSSMMGLSAPELKQMAEEIQKHAEEMRLHEE